MGHAQVVPVKKMAQESEAFRKVLFTADKSQLVLMSLQPGEDIGLETHDVDQMLYAVDGSGRAVIAGEEKTFEKGSILCVPAGTRHNVVNTGKERMKLFTFYAPPQHAPGTLHRTKADAEKEEPATRHGVAM